jgi:hypothetical protein
MEWDEIKVLGFLESEPEILDSEYCGPSYEYKISKHDLCLGLSVSPLEGDLSIHIKMANIEKPILEYILLDCERMKILKDSQDNEILEIKASDGMYLHISVQPSIHIKVGGHAL